MVSIFIYFHIPNFGMWQTTTLKRNLVPRFGEARKKDEFGILGGLPPLKETFVGSLVLGLDRAHLGFDLALGHLLNPYVASTFTHYSIQSSSRWLEHNFPPL
jgi:hypothetical protein